MDESIIRITDELTRLWRVHGALYRISFDPLSIFPWRARVLGSRRKLEDSSPARLRRSIGLDKQAAAKRASTKISLTATLSLTGSIGLGIAATLGLLRAFLR